MLIFLTILAMAGSQEQRVSPVTPEQVHKDAVGPSTMCGVTARTALEFRAIIEKSPQFHRQPLDSARFELFSTDDSFTQWVFTKSSEPAYPAVSCRHAFQDKDGGFSQTRELHCDASREACDKLFIEFRDLDERMRQSFKGS